MAHLFLFYLIYLLPDSQLQILDRSSVQYCNIERGVVQLDDGYPHGAAELKVDQRIYVSEGRITGDVGEYGVSEEGGEHGLEPRLLGIAALVSGDLVGLRRGRIHRFRRRR